MHLVNIYTWMSNRDQLKSMYTKLTEMNEFLGGDKLGSTSTT